MNAPSEDGVLMRVRLTLGLAALVVTLLAGCSDVDRVVEPLHLRSDVKMTPAEARADLDKRESDLTILLGGMWDNQDNLIASSCGDNDEGLYYYGGRNRTEPIADRAATAKSTAAWWKSRGVAVSSAKYGETYILKGEAKNGTTTFLHFDADRTWLETEGACVPGDWEKARDDDIAHRRNDIVRTSTPAPTATH